MKRKLSVWFLLLSVVAVFCCSALALTPQDGVVSREDKTLSPYFFVEGDPSIDHMPLKDTNVEINVSGIIADVAIRQTYRNDGARPINARYVFPASTRAAVYAMRMKIGDQVIIAKTKEREKARQEFEKAKEGGKSASLLEQDRPNVFSMNIANIIAGEQVEIELRYTELLVPTDGVYEVVYPTVVGPRYASDPASKAGEDRWIKSPYMHEGTKPTSTLHVSARISAGVPIRDLSCASHSITPRWESPSVAHVVLEAADPFQGNRDFVLRYRLLGEQITSGLILYQGQDENFFLYMAQPPERIQTADMPGREYIFVIDVSGSMDGYPLDTAKSLVRDLIGQLRPVDSFNVVLFAGGSTVLSEQSMPANQQNIAQALRLVDEQRGGGGTELLAALQRATNLPRHGKRSRSIVLITDGYVSAEKEVFDHIRDHLDQSNVFAFGIGTSVNRYLIEGIAKAGMGEPFVVINQSEAPAVASQFREYIQAPLLTSIHVDASDFDVYDVEPAKLPDLFAKRPIVLYGKWRGPVRGAFEMTGLTGHGEYTNRLDIGGVQPDHANRALRYFWARSRIAELSDYGSSDVDEARIRSITNLGLKYNLLTEYTSFIAVRETVTNTQGAEDVDQPLPLPIGVSDLAVGSEPELIWLICASILVGLLMMLRWRRRLA